MRPDQIILLGDQIILLGDPAPQGRGKPLSFSQAFVEGLAQAGMYRAHMGVPAQKARRHDCINCGAGITWGGENRATCAWCRSEYTS